MTRRPGNVVMFGGQNRHGELRSTWVWDGSTWTQQHPTTSPPALADASMVYNAATGNVVMFGGLTGGRVRPIGGTWVWDGSTWTMKSTPVSPTPRHGAAIAYDAATGNVILFGGYSGNGRTADTWVWNGSAWTMRSPATIPPPRYEASMTYDAAAKNLVLFGGSPADPITWTYGSS
jgi:hypothetical protein